MNLFKSFSILIFVFLTTSAVTLAQVPLNAFPPDDGTKSYYVTGTDGTNIFVDEKGDPKKTTIIFSSGYTTSRTSWNPQWVDPELYEKFHLVRYDYRGLGNSDKPSDANFYSLDLYASDLFSVISNITSKYNFKKKKTVLVGWSIGTPISLNFMKSYPNVIIDSIISVSGIVNNTRKFDDRVASSLQYITDPQDSRAKVIFGFEGFIKLFSFKLFSEELRSFFLGNAVMTPLEYRKSITVPFNLEQFYSTLTIPTLHIIGNNDILVDLEHSLYFASLSKNIKTIFYKDVGHCPLWENTKEFNKDIVNFVSKI